MQRSTDGRRVESVFGEYGKLFRGGSKSADVIHVTMQRILLLAVLMFMFFWSVLSFNSASSAQVTTVDRDLQRDRFILQLAPDLSLRDIDSLRATYQFDQITKLSSRGNLWVASVRVDAEVDALRAQTSLLGEVRAHRFVERIEPDYRVYAFDTAQRNQSSRVRPNDPYYDEQWALDAVNLADAWTMTTGRADVVIAVLDSGAELDHPDLRANLTEGYDFVNGDDSPDDDLGHGTHVASIIAGTTNNGVGVAGVNWHSRIMPIKVLDENGVGSISQIIQGIEWAVEHGADVINLSLGSPSNSDYLFEAVKDAIDQGVVIVAASGNEYEEDDELSYPSAYTEVDLLAVGAINEEGEHASFSSSGNHIDLVAPGVDVLAATWSGSGAEYAFYSGTSMSAPFVSGIAGLLLSVDEQLTPYEIVTLLNSTASDVGEAGKDTLTGYGLVNAAAAVTELSDLRLTPTSTPSPTPSPTPQPDPRQTIVPTPTATPAATPDVEAPGPAVGPTPAAQIYFPFLP